MLTGKQRNYLSSLANGMEPVLMVGKFGFTEALAQAARAEFEIRELYKMRFVGRKGEKREISNRVAEACGAELVRITGNVALLFRRNPSPEKRKVEISG
jgi:RNA-binding protein